jgi:hypothetical protein
MAEGPSSQGASSAGCPGPRHAGFGLGPLAILSFVLFPLVLLWRPLFAGEALFWGTPLLQFVPWQRMAAEMWRAGQLPLWNSLLGCGAPLAANYQTGAFYPLYALALVLPAEVAQGWTVALHLVLAGLGMYAWARAAGLERFPALLAGLALEGSGFLVARAGLFPSVAVTFPWIPIWLWRAERLVQTGRVRDALWLGGAVGLGLLAGHAQTAVYGLLLLAVYVAWRTLCCTVEDRRGAQDGPPAAAARRPQRVARRFSLALLAVLLGLALAAVQLAPTAELFRLSHRATGVDHELGLTYSFWPWRLLTLLAPDFFGNPARGDYWGYGNYWEDAAYVGLLPLLLAVEAVVGLRRRTPRRGPTSFWLLVLGASLLLALGRNSPLSLWLFDHVPTFDWFQAPARWLALSTVALAALAGIGAQQWRRGRAAFRSAALAVVLGLAAVLGGLAATWLLHDLRPTFAPATVRTGLTLALAGGLVLVRREASWWQLSVIGLVLLDLLIFGWGLAPSVDRALYAGQSGSGASLGTDPTVERVFWPAAGRPEPGYELKFGRYFRFDTFGPRDLAFWQSLRATLLPNLGMLDGVPSANNFEPLLVGAYADVVRTSDSLALARVMGVTHLITATADARVRVTPVDGSLGRAWVVPTARQVPRQEMLAAMTNPAFDPATEVLLEVTPEIAVTSQPADLDRQSVSLSDAWNRTTIRAVLQQPGYLVVADTWYPGWQATVDGEAVPILRANYAFRAVRLEAGTHSVEMVYRPRAVAVGVAVSLASLAALAGGLCLVRRRGRQA